MNIEAFDNQIRSLRQRIKNMGVAKNNNYVYTAFFIKNGRSDCMLKRVSVDSFPLIRKNLLMEMPDKVRVELYESEKSKKVIYQKSIDLRDIDVIDDDFDSKAFQGLGEAEVNEIVRTKLSEIQKQTEFKNLEAQNAAYEKRIIELEKMILENEEKIEELEESVKLKSGIKYYAGILGDLLEGFGIAKDKIGKPIAALMGMGDENEENEAPQLSNKSRIIEDGGNAVNNQVDKNEQEKQKKRKELIDLIVQYLQHGSDLQLVNTFRIFSAIEKNPEYAEQVLNYLETIKNQ